MSSNAAPTIIALSLLAAVCSACQAAPHNWGDDYNFVWHGEHVSVYGFDREPEEAFAGSMQFTDDYAGVLADYLGYSLPAPINYQWMSPEFFEGKCPGGASACTAWGRPRAQTIPHMHEIAHAVSYASGRYCASVLEEGLAEYFSWPRFEFTGGKEPEFDAEIEDILTGAPIRYSGYPRAGHFAAFLVETYGVDAVVELCQAVPIFNETADWERAFEAVFDTSLAALLNSYAEYPLCTPQQYRARLMECRGEIDITVDPYDNTAFSVVMNGDQDDIIGPLDGKMIAIRRVWVEEFTYALVTLRTQAGSIPRNAMASQQCVPCSAKPQVNASIDPSLTFVLPAGRHAFFFYRHVDHSDVFDVTIVPQHGWGS